MKPGRNRRIHPEHSPSRSRDPKYVEQAQAKLAKIGYRPAPETSDAAPEGEARTRSCTVEQISAMVRAGFSDEQIKAACPD